MNDQWIAYARKTAAFEKKWKPRIISALSEQLKAFINDYRQGYANYAHFIIGDNLQLLHDIYRNVGAYFAKQQYKELRAELRGSTQNANGQRQQQPGNQASISKTSKRGMAQAGMVLPSQLEYRVKFLGLGFNEDWAKLIIERLQENALELAQGLSNTTRKKVVMILQYAQEQNLAIEDIIELLLEEIQEFNRRRAETIARTEVGRAANEGKMLAAQSMGVAMDKIWITARDERVRRRPRDKADHLRLHEQSVSLDKPFDNGLSQPGDKTGKPEETINCRCTVVFKVKRDAQGQVIPQASPFIINREVISNITEGILNGINIGTLVAEITALQE
jgi:uncharacterized protein with gpF-like domain